MVYMIESQIAYVIDALRAMRDSGADIVEVKPEVEARATTPRSSERMQGTVWNTGCASWYQDAQGNNPTLWPDWTWRFRRRDGDSFNPQRSTWSHEQRVIITGAAGGIGSATVELLRARARRSSASTWRGADTRVRRARPGVGRRARWPRAIERLGGGSTC